MDVGKSSEEGAEFPGRERKHLSCLLCTASGLWEELMFTSVLFVYFTIQFRYPSLHLLLSILLCMCNLGECMWNLNFKFCGKHRLLLWCCKTPFTELLNFQKSKENDGVCFEAFVWVSTESHLCFRGLLIPVWSISVNINSFYYCIKYFPGCASD